MLVAADEAEGDFGDSMADGEEEEARSEVVDNLARAARASGKFGGVTGVFDGVHIG